MSVTERNCVRVCERPGLMESLREETASNDHLVALAAYMSAAANETRMRILYALWRASELCVCDLADIFGISQPAVSRHMKILREKALVASRRDSQTIFYRVCEENAFAAALIDQFRRKQLAVVELHIPSHA